MRELVTESSSGVVNSRLESCWVGVERERARTGLAGGRPFNEACLGRLWGVVVGPSAWYAQSWCNGDFEAYRFGRGLSDCCYDIAGRRVVGDIAKKIGLPHWTCVDKRLRFVADHPMRLWTCELKGVDALFREALDWITSD